MNYYQPQVTQSQQQSALNQPLQPQQPPPVPTAFVAPPIPQQQQRPPQQPGPAQMAHAAQQYAILYQQQQYQQQQYMQQYPYPQQFTYQAAGMNQQSYYVDSTPGASAVAQPPPQTAPQLGSAMHNTAVPPYNYPQPQWPNYPQQQVYYQPPQPVYNAPPPVVTQEQRSASHLLTSLWNSEVPPAKREKMKKMEASEFISVKAIEQSMMQGLMRENPSTPAQQLPEAPPRRILQITPQITPQNTPQITPLMAVDTTATAHSMAPSPVAPNESTATMTVGATVAVTTEGGTSEVAPSPSPPQQPDAAREAELLKQPTDIRYKTPSPLTVGAVEPQQPVNSTQWRGTRSAEKRKRWPPSICYYCKLKGKPPAEFNNHNTVDANNTVTCLLLRANGCQVCGKTGDEAHPEINCPSRKEENENFVQFAKEVTANLSGPSRITSNGIIQGSHYHHPQHGTGGSGGGPRTVFTNSNRSAQKMNKKP